MQAYPHVQNYENIKLSLLVPNNLYIFQKRASQIKNRYQGGKVIEHPLPAPSPSLFKRVEHSRALTSRITPISPPLDDASPFYDQTNG